MIRIVTLVAAAAVVTSAAAQITDTALLSPVPLTAADWAVARVVKKSARLTPEVASPAPTAVTPVPAVAPPAAPPAVATVPALPAVQHQPTGPALKREATVTGEIVRIGDLVDNAGAVAEVAIFRAPDLGQTGSVPAGRVAEAVRPHHILRLDTRGLDAVRVTRASRSIGPKDIEASIIRSIATQHGLADTANLAASFEGEMRTAHIETGAEPTVSRLSYDPRSRRFEALIDLPSGAARRPLLRVAGSLVETSETVVALRPIAQGEVLRSADLRIERRPKTEAATIEEIVGLAAKRALKPGQVIRAADVMRPELVARNESVTVIFEVPGMVLTTLGKAIESGALGDVISVVNVQSKRTIQATVRGSGRVSVTAATPRLAAATSEPSPPPQR
jgi:flagella basal body P-ring formation protein FlgA